MKHLILGSEGQIGWHLKNYLISQHEEIIEFDIVRTEQEDLRIFNNSLFERRLKECDFVHFLAFDVGGSDYMLRYQDKYNFISNNIQIMDRVFERLNNYNKPFIFASSQMSNMMHSTYGILKMIGEKYTTAIGGIIVKLWNVYGYERVPEKTHVITDFIEMAKKYNKISMRTDGQEERQFLFGDDAAECLYTISKKYSSIDRNSLIHITNHKWTKIIDIARIISEYHNNCEIILSDQKDNLQHGFKNEPDDYILKYWQPRTSLKEGIKKTIELHRI